MLGGGHVEKPPPVVPEPVVELEGLDGTVLLLLLGALELGADVDGFVLLEELVPAPLLDVPDEGDTPVPDPVPEEGVAALLPVDGLAAEPVVEELVGVALPVLVEEVPEVPVTGCTVGADELDPDEDGAPEVDVPLVLEVPDEDDGKLVLGDVDVELVAPVVEVLELGVLLVAD